ncbi:MAG: hypothetical protein IJX25_00520 [Clostridia bacterium]|nr:hypothetical protein [Clostridia bacterium]MBQ8792564.1 hypothetical protein [Clostridia bacterium]
MKKTLLFLIFILIFSSSQASISIAYADDYYWAKVEGSGTLFYALPNEQSPLFLIPQSYFVKLTGQEDGFYIAQYKDLTGYVKKEEVSPMDGTPTTPYFNENFRTFIPSGTGLYALTQMDEQYKILTVPYLYENLVFYGSIPGETAIPDKSDVWHYCKYEEDNYGYVYSSFCDKLSSPPTNSEIFTKLDDISFSSEESVTSLSPTAMAFIIVGVSLPCLIVLYLLMKPNMMKAKLPREKVKYKSSKRRDYFEFDQSDLS